MSEDVTYKVEGLGTLLRTLKKAGLDIEELKDANAAAAEMVAAAAMASAPRRTGLLGSSVRGSRKARGATVMAGRASVPYAGPIHWGWPARGIAANPFISDAATSTETRWVAIYQRDVQKALDHVRGA